MLLYIQRSRLVNNVHFIDWMSMLPEEFNTSKDTKNLLWVISLDLCSVPELFRTIP